MSERNSRAIYEAVHGEQPTSIPGLPMIRVARHDPRHRPQPIWDDEDEDGDGWGPSVEVPATALFPWLTEDR